MLKFKRRITAYRLIFLSLGPLRMFLFILANSRNQRKTFLATFKKSQILLRSSTDDLYVAQEILSGSEYQSINSDLLSSCKSDLIVDVGAHIGSGTMMLRQMFPQHRIVAIEPEIRNFELLKINTSGMSGVTLFNRALVGTLKIKDEFHLVDRRDASGFTVVSKPLDNPKAQSIQKVAGLLLEQIVEQFECTEIAFLKVDIEGGEKELFNDSGFDPKKIFAAFIETHERIVEDAEEAVRCFFEKTHREIPCEGEKLLFVRK